MGEIVIQQPRYDLIPAHAYGDLADIIGNDPEWIKGKKWSQVIGSLEYHLNQLKTGKDRDADGYKNITHILKEAAILSEYYHIYPQGDDRQHKYLKRPKIGLDIDEVLADWLAAWCERHNIEQPVYFWSFDSQMKERFEEMKDDKDFWVNCVKPKIKASDLPFEPHCYITSRSIPEEWTREWLNKNGFPCVPLYSIGFNMSKVDIAKKSGVDVFVDDRYENFVELNNAGICTFLMDCPHNEKYDVGHKRIKNLSDLPY